MLAAFDAAAGEKDAPGGLAKGTEAILTALLESPSLVYLTELGPGGPAGSVVTLTPFEIASLLSFTLRGGPPDDALLQAAASGALLRPEAREAQARRLLAMSDTRFQFRRFILEWLEVDGLPRTVKSADLYPDYDEVKSHMLSETTAFADEVMVYAGGSVAALLGARFAIRGSRHGPLLRIEDVGGAGVAGEHAERGSPAASELSRGPRPRGRDEPGQARRLRPAAALVRARAEACGGGHRSGLSAAVEGEDHAGALLRALREPGLSGVPRSARRARLHVRGVRRGRCGPRRGQRSPRRHVGACRGRRPDHDVFGDSLDPDRLPSPRAPTSPSATRGRRSATSPGRRTHGSSRSSWPSPAARCGRGAERTTSSRTSSTT